MARRWEMLICAAVHVTQMYWFMSTDNVTLTVTADAATVYHVVPEFYWPGHQCIHVHVKETKQTIQVINLKFHLNGKPAIF